MAGFLDEFVKLTVNETIGTDYPHIRHPALYQAKVMEGTVKDGASYVTLRLHILLRNFPEREKR